MSLPTKPRFIAGAVCPRCGEMDKIMAHQQDDKSIRRCVACDFEESKTFLLADRELPTRVNQVEGSEVGSHSPSELSSTQTIKIVSGGKEKQGSKD